MPAGHEAVRARSRRRRVGQPGRRREAPLRAHDGGVRRLPRAHRPPHRAAARLPREDGPARRHADHGRQRQRRQRRGRPARLGQREPVLQQRPRDAGGRPRGDRRPGRAEVLQPLPVGLGLGRQHAVPPLEARDLPRRRRRSVHRPLAGAASRPRARCATSTRTSSTWCRRCWTRSASTPPAAVRGVTQSPIQGVSFAHAFGDAKARDPPPHAVLRDDGPPRHLSRRLARGLPGAGAVVRRGGHGLRRDGHHRGEAARARREGLGALPRRRGLLGDARTWPPSTATS